MNTVVMSGRIATDLELRGNEKTSFLRFSLAVDGYGKGNDRKTDFFNCLAFGKTAEFINDYSEKGKKALVKGRLQTGHYMKDNVRVNTVDLIIENFEPIEWAEKKKEEAPTKVDDDFGADFDPTSDDSRIPF